MLNAQQCYNYVYATAVQENSRNSHSHIPVVHAQVIRNSFDMQSMVNQSMVNQSMVNQSMVNQATDRKYECVYLCIDKSGSMDQDASNNEEAKGYSRRDFACQGAMLIIKALPVGTKVCVLSFNHESDIVIEPTIITNLNRQFLCDRILTITAYDGTNILGCLKHVKEIMEHTNTNKAKVILITDGEDPELTCGNGLDKKFKSLKKNAEMPFEIDTIGLGPSADTQLLVKIANMSHGNYALCYSAFEVGTVFGRSAARLQLDNDDIFGICINEEGIYKQKFMEFKDLLVEILLDELLSKYDIDSKQNEKIKNYIKKVTEWVNANRPVETSVYYDCIKDMLEDAKGQIHLAITKSDYWETWGYSYWQTMGNALKKCYSPNSKDASLSHFGSEKANALYDEISTLYESMPLIQKTGSSGNCKSNGPAYVQPLTTSYFNDRDAGCFHPSSTCTLPNGEKIGYESILQKMQQGGEVWLMGQNNKPVKVEVLIQTPLQGDYNNIKFCKIGNTVLTPNHPIYVKDNDSNTTGRWEHPQKLAPIFTEDVGYVFNFILAHDENGKRYESVLVNDQLCVCLGHGITDGSPAEDCFWGSESVVNSYKQLYLESYQKGYIDYLNHQFLIDEKTGHVIGFKSN